MGNRGNSLRHIGMLATSPGWRRSWFERSSRLREVQAATQARRFEPAASREPPRDDRDPPTDPDA